MLGSSKPFRRLRALTSFLLATTAVQQSAEAQEFPATVPTNASDCANILTEVVTAIVVSGASPGDFLRETNADHILRQYCESGQYERAYQYGKEFFDGFMQPAAPSTGLKSECLVERSVAQWRLTATADRYYMTQFVPIASLNEDKIRAGSDLFAVVGKPSDADREIRLRLPFVAGFSPTMMDVEVKDAAGGEPSRASVPIMPGNTLDISRPTQPFAERNTTLEISGSLDGTRLFTTSVTYTGVHVVSFAAFDDIERLSQSRRRGGCVDRQCFLTTACCDLMGLDDDCFELRSLRAFRDRALPSLPGGTRDIALYYETAPGLLAAMRRAGSERALLGYYLSHILPCAVLARVGLNAATQWLYRDLMRRLEARYMPGAVSLPRV